MQDTQEIYMLDNAGKLFRKGVEIGKLDGDTLTLHPDHQNFRASVTRWVNSQAKREEAQAEPAPETVQTIKTEVIPSDEQIAKTRMAAVSREVEKARDDARKQWQEDCDFAKKTGCPMPPKKNPQFGDKSPAFVEWLHQYRFEEFCKRYGVIRKGKKPVIKTNPETGMEEVVGYADTYFATRKTHLTEVDNSERTLGDDMDWNA